MNQDLIQSNGIPNLEDDPAYWIDHILNDLFFLCSVVLHHDKTVEYRDLNWIHKELCDHLDPTKNPIEQILVLMSRDMLKSSIARGLLIQWFVQQRYKNEPDKAFIYSGLSDLAEDHAERIWREIVRNKPLQALFGYCLPQKKTDFDVCSKEKIRYKGIEIDIGSPEKSLTGHHYGLGINDNLVNEVNSDTFDKRRKINRRWQQQEAILAEDAREIIFETTWWPDDVSGIILNPDGKFNYSKLHRKPALKFISDTGYSVFSCPCRDQEGNPVFAEKMGEKYLARKRAKMGSYLYSALYDLQPVAEEDIVFKPGWISHYDELPNPFIRNMIVDCAGLKKKDSSYSAISLGDWNMNGQLHISFAQRRKLSPMELEEWIYEIVDRCKKEDRPVYSIGIEEEKYGIFLVNLMRSRRPDLHVIPIPIKSMPRPTRNHSLVPRYENNDILSKPGLDDYEDEVRTYYLGKEKGVDILDTIYYHWRIKFLPARKAVVNNWVPRIMSDFEKSARRDRATFVGNRQSIARMF